MPNLINETLIFQPNIPKKKTEITNSITRNVMVFYLCVLHVEVNLPLWNYRLTYLGYKHSK